MDEIERCIATQAITELVTRYNRAVDDHRGGDIAALFTEDGSLETMGRVITGRANLAAIFAEARSGPVERPLTAHHVTNLVIELDDGGTTATAESDFLVVRRIDESIEPQLAGRYRDRLRREDGVWRFARRTTVPLARSHDHRR